MRLIFSAFRPQISNMRILYCCFVWGRQDLSIGLLVEDCSLSAYRILIKKQSLSLPRLLIQSLSWSLIWPVRELLLYHLIQVPLDIILVFVMPMYYIEIRWKSKYTVIIESPSWVWSWDSSRLYLGCCRTWREPSWGEKINSKTRRHHRSYPRRARLPIKPRGHTKCETES